MLCLNPKLTLKSPTKIKSFDFLKGKHIKFADQAVVMKYTKMVKRYKI